MDSATVHLTYRTDRLQAEAANRRLIEPVREATGTGLAPIWRRARVLAATGLALALAATIATSVLAIPADAAQAPSGGLRGSALLHR